MRSVALLVLVACAGEGDRPLTVRIAVSSDEPAPVPGVPSPVVHIDGIERTSFEHTYASYDLAAAEQHLLELRYGDRTIRQVTVDLRQHSCPGGVEPGGGVRLSYCSYQSGDLRLRASVVQDPPCIADGFCFSCMTTGCGAGKRCSSRITSSDPPASYLDCVPSGPRLIGDSCTLVPDADGAYDDCAGGSLCVAGVCRQTCQAPSQCVGEVCEHVPGHAPEMRVCM